MKFGEWDWTTSTIMNTLFKICITRGQKMNAGIPHTRAGIRHTKSKLEIQCDQIGRFIGPRVSFKKTSLKLTCIYYSLINNNFWLKHVFCKLCGEFHLLLSFFIFVEEALNLSLFSLDLNSKCNKKTTFHCKLFIQICFSHWIKNTKCSGRRR